MGMIPSNLDDPLYYLHNFRQVLDWVAGRYADLLTREEHDFITAFIQLDQPSQALLVRLVMRKGPHFRADKLTYPEVGDISCAAIDDYLAMRECRDLLDSGTSALDALKALQPLQSDSRWLAHRYARLCFRLARQLEREGFWQQAWDLYSDCTYPGSLARRVRLLEQRADWPAAWALSQVSWEAA